MIRMAQANTIKDLYENEGASLREISRRTGLSFQTVRKYAQRDDWNGEKEAKPGRKPENYPALGPYIPTIDAWLEADRKIPRKQRHTAMRVYQRLRDEEGYQGCYSSVKRYVRRKKRALKMSGEEWLPLDAPEGCAQTDFGEFLYYDAEGKGKKGHALTVTFPYSNHAYTQVFPSQNQECLLEGLKRVFERVGGVPLRIRFDNLSPAVVEVLEGTERVLTDGFTRFKLHYRFQADFCNPGKGNEKGNVENKVGYSRRNLFVPVPTITDFAAFNESLWEKCDKDAEREHYRKKRLIRELWEEERGKLLTLPEHPYDVFHYVTLAVNKCGFVTIETNRYGLNPALAGETVQAKIRYDRVEFFYGQRPVGEYERHYGRNQEFLDWRQYTSALTRKPGATEHTRFFDSMPETWREHLSRIQGKERRSALELLSEIVRDGNAELCADALELAAENGRTDAESIRQCYYMVARKEFRPNPLRLDNDAPPLNYSPDLSAYDTLTGGEGHV